MRRTVLMAAMLVVVMGCEQAGEKDPLTSQQRTAWEKVRADVADFPYIVVGYDVDRKEWMTLCYVDPNLYRYAWRTTMLDLWSKEQLDDAKFLAKKQADNSSIVTTAVVDLLGKDNPYTLVWYFKDGSVMKSSNRAPRAHLETELRKYLQYIQSSPDMVKPPKV